MPAQAVLLDVIRHFESARDAANFIKAAGIPLEHVPVWPKKPVPKVQVGECSDTTTALYEKGYYELHRAAPFTSRHESYASCINIVNQWVLAIAKYGFDEYWKNPYLAAQVSRYLDSEVHRLDPLIAMIATYYARKSSTKLACYMDRDECFVCGERGWEPAALETVLTEMVQNMAEAIKQAIELMVQRVTAYEAVGFKLPERDLNLQNAFYKTRGMLPEVTAEVNDYTPHVEAIKRLLRRNKEQLAELGAFED